MKNISLRNTNGDEPKQEPKLDSQKKKKNIYIYIYIRTQTLTIPKVQNPNEPKQEW